MNPLYYYMYVVSELNSLYEFKAFLLCFSLLCLPLLFFILLGLYFFILMKEDLLLSRTHSLNPNIL